MRKHHSTAIVSALLIALSASCRSVSADKESKEMPAPASAPAPVPASADMATSSESEPAPDALSLKGSEARRTDAIVKAQEHIKAHPGKMAHDADHEFKARDVIFDEDGSKHVRFDRKYRGYRVIGGDVIVHSNKDESFSGATVGYAGLISVPAKAPVNPAAAIKAAKAEWSGAPGFSTSQELIVFANVDPAVLAYEVVLTGFKSNGDPSEMHIIVDANTPKILDRWEGIETVIGQGRGFYTGAVSLNTVFSVKKIYELRDGLRGNQQTFDMQTKQSGPGKLFTDSDNIWGNGLLSDRATIGVDGQFGAAKTWDYYKTQHGRIGIRNDGIGASSRVHYGRGYNNAFWSDACFCMTYGDGDGITFSPFTSLDVAGHEMSHGVTAATSNLQYSGETGGLNEANSDIFGTMVEFYANNAVDTPDYLIGEKLFKAPGRALRYMYKPSLDGISPDCYSATVAALDVHYSSAIGNHFYYLLAEGSAPAAGPASPTCNGTVITGIGRTDAAKIWYRANTVYMISTTKYAGARVASVQAAADLFGVNSVQQAAVISAWTAVSVN